MSQVRRKKVGGAPARKVRPRDYKVIEGQEIRRKTGPGFQAKHKKTKKPIHRLL